MKKILLITFMFVTALVTQSWAQDSVISGKITSAEDGSALPGVNVILKGTTTGTTSDIDGNFKLDAPVNGTLVFSFIGLSTQEIAVGAKSIINVAMIDDAKQLSEVVVTAIGVEKDTRSIGYSATKITAQEVSQGQASSLVTSLQGRVAGAQVTSGSGAPGSSTKVIIRGFTSLSGANNPLYVVDGVPVNNSFTGNTTLNGGSDLGTRINDINPEDIESLTVLKGAAATVLYGSRAAAGVILITTKSGKNAAKRGKKAEVSVSSSLTFDEVLKLPDYQNERGQGFFGSTSRFLNENTSWGSKFDGQDHLWGREVDNQQRIKPFVALPNNVKDFFDIGKTFTNSVSLQGGNENSNYYVSFSNVDADGVMPTDADSYKRNTFAMRASTELSNRITTSGSFNYIRTKTSFVPTGQGETVFNNILQTPRDIPLLELSDIEGQFDNPSNFYSPFTTNPYYALANFQSDAVIDRFFGNAEVVFKANDWLSLLGRVGTDVTRTDWTESQPKLTVTGANSSKSNPGNFIQRSNYDREFNFDGLANFNFDINNDFGLTGLVGGNVNQRQRNNLFTQINDLVVPGFYDISNTANTPTASRFKRLRRSYAAYAQADLAFRDYLFLTLSARNDWSSTLPKENRSYFFSGASLAFDITSALKVENNIFSYGKIRVGYAQVGNDANTYVVNSVFVKGEQTDGFIFLKGPIAQSIPTFEVGNRVGNQNLQPEISTELEIGGDFRFFSNRVGLDITYYSRDISDNILDLPIAVSSGITVQTANIAKMTNKGIEVLLTGTPLKLDNFRWDVSLNWSRNRGKIIDLGGPDQISLGGLGGNALIARVGGPTFEIEGDVPLLDDNGNIVVSASGEPIANPVQEVIGSTQYDWIGGVTNKFSYKGLSFSATFDVREGGVLYSRTASLGYFAGTTPATLYNDRRPFIIPGSVVQPLDGDGNLAVDENGNPIYVENTQQISHENRSLQNFWTNGGVDLDKAYLVDKSFVKLREVVLSYNLPSSITDKVPFGNINISVIGRNLLLWVPSENLFIDPEQTTFGAGIKSEFGEFGAAPTTRSYGFNVKFTF